MIKKNQRKTNYGVFKLLHDIVLEKMSERMLSLIHIVVILTIAREVLLNVLPVNTDNQTEGRESVNI